MGASLLATDLLAASKLTTSSDVSIGHLLLQMVVAMLIIVGGIWAFGKLVGRSRAAGRHAGRKAGGFLRQRAEAQGLTILSRQPLGKGKCLAVVQVGAQQFLVGIADSGLTPLGELHTGDVAAPAAATAGDWVDVPATTGGALGAADLSTIDLRALGVRSLDLAAFGAVAGGSAPGALGAAAHGAAASTPPATRSLRTWVDSLREATVRR